MKSLTCFIGVIPQLLMITFPVVIACQPQGLNERTIHPPHELYLNKLKPENNDLENQNDLQQSMTKIGQLGLPTDCKLKRLEKGICIECFKEPITILRCNENFSSNFSPDVNCRYTINSIKCLERSSRQTMIINYLYSQESRFLQQLDMISETLNTIFQNEIKDQAVLVQCQKILEYIKTNKVKFLDQFESSTAIDPIIPSTKDRKRLLIEISTLSQNLNRKRIDGRLETKDAFYLLASLFKAYDTDPEVMTILNEIDLEGLDAAK